MQKMKMLTPGDIERLAKRNAQVSKATHQLNRPRGFFEPAMDLKHLGMMPREMLNKHLHAAIDAGKYDLVLRVLDAGANANSQVDGVSAVERAARLRDIEAMQQPIISIYGDIIALLVKRGATPEK